MNGAHENKYKLLYEKEHASFFDRLFYKQPRVSRPKWKRRKIRKKKYEKFIATPFSTLVHIMLYLFHFVPITKTNNTQTPRGNQQKNIIVVFIIIMIFFYLLLLCAVFWYFVRYFIFEYIVCFILLFYFISYKKIEENYI